MSRKTTREAAGPDHLTKTMFSGYYLQILVVRWSENTTTKHLRSEHMTSDVW